MMMMMMAGEWGIDSGSNLVYLTKVLIHTSPYAPDYLKACCYKAQHNSTLFFPLHLLGRRNYCLLLRFRGGGSTYRVASALTSVCVCVCVCNRLLRATPDVGVCAFLPG